MLRVVVLCETAASGWPVCLYLKWNLSSTPQLEPVLAVLDARDVVAVLDGRNRNDGDVNAAVDAAYFRDAGARAIDAAIGPVALNNTVPLTNTAAHATARLIDVVVVGTGLGGVAAMHLHMVDSHCGVRHWRVFDVVTLGAPLRPMFSSRPTKPWPHRFCNLTFGLLGSSDTVHTANVVESATVQTTTVQTTRGQSAAVQTTTPPTCSLFTSLYPATVWSTAASWVLSAARRVWRSEHCVDDAHAEHMITLDHPVSNWNPSVLARVCERVSESHEAWLFDKATREEERSRRQANK